MLALSVLGGFQVSVDGHEVAGFTAQPSRAALLVFLALERSTTRDVVVGLLWPEHDTAKARHALSQTLSRLRGALGEGWLEADGERLALAPGVDVDARAFESLIEAGEPQRAVALYGGPFIPGWFLADSPAFELWVDRQRARLDRLHRRARRECVRAARERGDLPGALQAAQEWAELDPLEDEAQHRLIELLVESGRRAEALRQFDLYRRLLEKEELSPLDETVELVARLRQASDLGPLAEAQPAKAPPAIPAAPPPAPAQPSTATPYEARAAAAPLPQPPATVAVGPPTPPSPAEPTGDEAAGVFLFEPYGVESLPPSPGLGAAAAPAASGTHPPTAPARAQPAAPAATSSAAPRPLRRGRPRRWRRAAVGVVALVLVVGAALLIRGLTSEARARRLALPPHGRVLLADFGNDTRDSLISGVVTEALRIDLTRRLHSAVVDPAEVARTLVRMQRPSATHLVGETAREVAERAGIPAVIDGKVGAVGPGFVLSAWIVATGNGRILDAVLATARDSTELIGAIERLSLELGGKIRPSLLSLPQPAPLAQVTTGSVEALRKYTLASRVWWQQGDGARAVRLYDEAIALDSTFAMAHRTRAMVLMNIGAPRTSWVPSLEKAYQYRDRLGEPERGLAIAAYHHLATGNTDEAVRAYENVLELDTANVVALNNLGYIYRDLRDFARAETILKRCVAVEPLGLTCPMNLVGVVNARGRFAEARAIAERLGRSLPDNPLARAEAAYVAAADQDYGTADSLLAVMARGNPPNPASLEFDRGMLDMVRGRIAETRRHLEAAYRLAGRTDAGEAGKALLGAAHLDLFVVGDTARALAEADAALRDPAFASLAAVDYPYLDLADFYLAAGQPARAEAQLRSFLAAVPPDLRRPADRRLYAVRGFLAMQRGRYEEAAEAFRVADTRPGSLFLVLWHLGPLHESAGRPDSAIAAYERYLGPGTPDRLYYDAVLLPTVLERLAALHEARGHRPEAARYYARFAALWAGADPELQPRVLAAQRRARELAPAAPAPRRS